MFNKLFVNLRKKMDIGEPPYDYSLLVNLDEKEYPKYLKKIFYYMTEEKLNLKNPKTFNEKIQWLKLFDSIPLKTQLTDKVLVRDWVKSKIGEKYLKPVLWIGKSFDEIPFDKLPEQFIIKCNHGCKWHYKIKNKQKFLQNKQLFDFVAKKINGWMKQSFFPFAGFEMQYKDIKPQIIIEQLLSDNENQYPIEYEIYCFNGKPKIYQKIKYSAVPECVVYDEFFNECDISFCCFYLKKSEKADQTLKDIVSLSSELAKDFYLVRVDWMIFNNSIYFNEMTFTPFSGFFMFPNKADNILLGNFLQLRKR